MRKRIVGVLAACLLASPAAAQSITPYAGYVWFGDLPDVSDVVRLENEDDWIVGAQAAVRLGSTFSLVGNVAHTRTDLQFGGAGLPQPTSGELGLWLYDAGLELAFPVPVAVGSIAPFVQAGVGAVRYTAERDDFDSESRTDVQFNLGGGLEFRTGAVGLRLMVRDYVTSLDWTDFDAFRDQVQDDVGSEDVLHNVALTLGLRIGF